MLWVCIRTFLVLPFRDRVGEVPENPGFWMPKPSLGFGFFRLDLRGDLATEDEAAVDPFDPKVVDAVPTDTVLPLVVIV